MRFKQFILEDATLTGYHYSNKSIEIGDVLKSSTSAANYETVWNIYKSVADELGKYWPKEFGYAYPAKKSMFGLKYAFEVEAPKSKVTKGNLNHSLHVTIDRLREFMDRSLPLEQRLEKRNERIKEEAIKYFKAEGNSIELISDVWKVKNEI